MMPFLDAPALLEIARAVPLSSAHPVSISCGCAKSSLAGWQSQPLSFDESTLEEIGTLMPPGVDEPSYEEYLPGSTTYWADDAPIAPRHFPYNRSGVWRCRVCASVFLRYTEGGGYFVDRRIRALDAALIQDVPLDGV
ncbi:hypothetical protein WM40_02570 [Robbsia andropogonis]|uniref:Uncharacterized protein n=1 Tax=Robbsia andropogonis TaxID=28092 RepID=A0A0F5K5T9_9BURK|nr:hypothetical protein [Robbsia andropogonis]KKB64902.1 hypothetical protein WM40_02570 [Robbsia andropogonis]MCP1119162.1 hypothetical protein [Robbsia andropogonis]MCP1128987.1 hypothetical protein [Robbsia andropogonis]